MKNDNQSVMQGRRQFCKTLGGGALALALGGAGALLKPAFAAADDERYFNIAMIADTHIIDEFYTGGEGEIYKSRNRLIAARAVLNDPALAIEQVFVAGDIMHNYPSTDYDFYFENVTRIDNAKEVLDGFTMPVHIALGNHDYDIGDIPIEFTHDLFKAKFGIDPYYAVDYKGWKFVTLSNFLGASMDHNEALGSFGETQLNWLEAQLQEGLPTIIQLHYPLVIVQAKEYADYGLMSLLREYRDTIKMVFSGHVHIWLQFSDLFGPLHYSLASTRYDKNAYFILRVDRRLNTFSVLNWDLVTWGTNNSQPYDPKRRTGGIDPSRLTARGGMPSPALLKKLVDQHRRGSL